MKDKNDIPSFTLSEMMAVLAITAIVVGLAFAVLNLVRKQTGNIMAHRDRAIKRDRLLTGLWIDFHSHRDIRAVIGPEAAILEFGNADNTLRYSFQRERTVRGLDTFPPLDNIIFLSEGEKVAGGKVDALQIDGGGAFIYRVNDAAYQMND